MCGYRLKKKYLYYWTNEIIGQKKVCVNMV